MTIAVECQSFASHGNKDEMIFLFIIHNLIIQKVILITLVTKSCPSLFLIPFMESQLKQL